MDVLPLAGALTWAVAFLWWGTELVLRAGRRTKIFGTLLIAAGLAPSALLLLLMWPGVSGGPS